MSDQGSTIVEGQRHRQPPIDPLSEALETLHVGSCSVFRFELVAPWGIRISRERGWFHAVRQGRCFLSGKGLDSALTLEADLQLAGHTPCDSPDDCPDGLTCNQASNTCIEFPE